MLDGDVEEDIKTDKNCALILKYQKKEKRDPYWTLAELQRGGRLVLEMKGNTQKKWFQKGLQKKG